MKTLRFGVSRSVAAAVVLAALALPAAAQNAGQSMPTDAAATPGMNMNAPGMNMNMGGGQGPAMNMPRMQGMRCPMMHQKRCGMMRHRGGMHMLPMPRLPPGNDKLQLQMEAEILQKIGEIQGKYASQLP